MKRKETLFGNLFDSRTIIPERLSGFGAYVKEALQNLPEAATYADIIAAIGEAIDKMSDDNTNVNVNLLEQKDDTSAVKTFVSGFVQYMRENEMIIGAAMGGAQSAGYKAFYPKGITEYARASYTRLKTLTSRVKLVTQKWGKPLSPDMQAALIGFSNGWLQQRGKQQGQMSTVKTDRTVHTAAYLNLQLVLTKAVHQVAWLNPGNEELGNRLFPFHMLYAESPNRHLELAGSLAVQGISTLMNRRLSTRVYLLVENVENNSDICLWLDATDSGKPPVHAVIVKAGETKNISAGRLGSLLNTFLMIANMSQVNTAQYKITVSGLPKDKKTKEEKDKKKEKKMKVTAA